MAIQNICDGLWEPWLKTIKPWSMRIGNGRIHHTSERCLNVFSTLLVLLHVSLTLPEVKNGVVLFDAHQILNLNFQYSHNCGRVFRISGRHFFVTSVLRVYRKKRKGARSFNWSGRNLVRNQKKNRYKKWTAWMLTRAIYN